MITFVIVSFGDKYNHYRDALVKSIKRNMPEAQIKAIELDPLSKKDDHLANHIKLHAWAGNIKGDTILIDADTIVLSDISEVFDLDADLIYTKRYHNRTIPFNSGVVFVKESGRHIIDKWLEIDEKMIKDKLFHIEWKRKYFGFNQASFGYLLENYPNLKIKSVGSHTYNSCDRYDWIHNYPNSKVAHVKSELRMSLERNFNKFPGIESRLKKYYL